MPKILDLINMDKSGILIDEAALASLDESKRPTFIFDWLQKLNKILANLTSSIKFAKPNQSHQEQETYINDKELVRKNQKQLVAQLTNLIQSGGTSIGPVIRQLIAVNLVALFIVGDTFLLFETINK